MTHLVILFCILIISIYYVESIDFINPTSSIDCGTSGEDCNLWCNKTDGCSETTITLYNNANFNLYCRDIYSCRSLSIYAYNVSNMQLIINTMYAGVAIRLFVEGIRSNTLNLYCDYLSCFGIEVRLLAPNLNCNIYCEWESACSNMFVSGKS